MYIAMDEEKVIVNVIEKYLPGIDRFCLLFPGGMMRLSGFFMAEKIFWTDGLRFHCHRTQMKDLHFTNHLSLTVTIHVYLLIRKSVNLLLWHVRVQIHHIILTDK